MKLILLLDWVSSPGVEDVGEARVGEEITEMIIRNYKNSHEKVSYTIDVDGDTFDMVHTRTSWSSVSMTKYDDFLEEIAEFDKAEADMIEEFIDLQSSMMIRGVSFWLEVADDSEV